MHSVFVDLTGGWHLHMQNPNKLVEETRVQKANWRTAHSTRNFSHNVFCQVLTHNGYGCAHSSRWLKMKLNGAVKKYNCTVCSPRCSSHLYSNLAMMTQDNAQCIMKSLPAS